MRIKGKTAVITGGASGIGLATARELITRGIATLGLVDRAEAVVEHAASLNLACGRDVVRPFCGDTTDEAFRAHVFDTLSAHAPVTICVPAAGVTRDGLSVKINRAEHRARLYPIESFREVVEINLIAPVYWALELIARIAEHRSANNLKRWTPDEGIQGGIVFIGSVSSQGNKGQIAYASTKVGLEGAAATLMKEAMFYGVRCTVLHPGFTDTPMVRALGGDYINEHIVSSTQIGRLIEPAEIADAIGFLLSNSVITGPVWADGGWHPSPN